MKRQRPVCHSEKRSDEESRFGSLITKPFSPQWSRRVGPRRENLDLYVGLKTSHKVPRVRRLADDRVRVTRSLIEALREA